jgi:hypothetical protein
LLDPPRGVLLGSGMLALPGRNFARFFLMNYILFSLVVRTGYQGVQYDMMLKVCLLLAASFPIQWLISQEIRPNNVETIDELIERNYTFYCHEDNLLFIKDMDFVER